MGAEGEGSGKVSRVTILPLIPSPRIGPKQLSHRIRPKWTLRIGPFPGLFSLYLCLLPIALSLGPVALPLLADLRGDAGGAPMAPPCSDFIDNVGGSEGPQVHPSPAPWSDDLIGDTGNEGYQEPVGSLKALWSL